MIFLRIISKGAYTLRHNLCNMQDEYKHRELTKKIIGCAMKVHNYFGPGFREDIYERSLLIELKKTGLECKNQLVKEVYYGDVFVGKKRLDVIVNDSVLLELKALPDLNNDSFIKIINYLKVFKIDVGLLLNFGSHSLQFKRFANSKTMTRFS